MTNDALIIFTKNLIYGNVKTRLAAVVGNKKAFNVYKKLIKHTHEITKQFACDIIVFYSDEIKADDIWQNANEKQLQKGNDLGEKMMNAFNTVFEKGYANIVIIGTDCPELNEEIINTAFVNLHKYAVVIGAAADGGYYLLGMKKMHRELFTNIEWSTNNVLQTTIKRCRQNHLLYFLLKELHDVDEEKDLQYMKTIQQ
jgi:rSAM/selenodomain-associated transferase 1